MKAHPAVGDKLLSFIPTRSDVVDDGFAAQHITISAALVVLVMVACLSYKAICLYVYGGQSTKERPWTLVPGWIPLAGHFHLVRSLKHLPGVAHDWANQYGREHGCFDVDLAGSQVTVICRKDRADELLKHRPNHVYRAPPIRESLASIGATGSIQAEGQQWKVEHKLMAAALNRKNVQDYLPPLKDKANRLLSKWLKNIDKAAPGSFSTSVEDDLTRMSADSIALVALERDFDFLNKQDQFGKDVRSIIFGAMFRALSPIWFWRIPFVGQYLDGLGFAIQRFRHLVDSIVQSYEKKMSLTMSSSPNRDRVSDKTSPSFLDKLYQVMTSEKTHLPRDRVLGNVTTLFLGGSDTTSKALTTALYVLAKSPELQKELQHEVSGFDLQTADMTALFGKLPRLKSFLHEVHRYYGNPIVLLQTKKDIAFCGTTLPKHSDVVLLTRYLTVSEHSQVTDIPDGPTHEPPDVFCPSRYLVEDPHEGLICKAPTAGLYGAATFGVGARHCPGRTYSEALSLCVLISLLQNIDIELVPNQREPKIVFDVLMANDYPVQLSLKKRVMEGRP